MLTHLNSNLKKHVLRLISLWRNNTDTSMLSKKELLSVSQSLFALQRGLTGNRELAGAGYMDSSSYLGAYLLYYWPVSYMQISYEANAIKNFVAKKELSILDVGSGPAPASAALCDAFSVKNVTMIDSSKKAMNLAEKIFKTEWKDCKVQTIVHNFESGQMPLVSEKYDIIVLSHSLNELWKNKTDAMERRILFLQKLADFLDNDGILLISEPALLETSRNLISIRDRLIEKLAVVSPCLCSCICPVSDSGTNQTCHAEINWKPVEPVASIAQLAKLDRQSVKMTYMAFSKNGMNNSCNAENNYRIVSDGMLNKSGRIRFLLCDGKKRIPCSAKKDDSYAQSQGFFSLSRYDTVCLENPELRGDAHSVTFGISAETKLQINRFAE